MNSLVFQVWPSSDLIRMLLAISIRYSLKESKKPRNFSLDHLKRKTKDNRIIDDNTKAHLCNLHTMDWLTPPLLALGAQITSSRSKPKTAPLINKISILSTVTNKSPISFHSSPRSTTQKQSFRTANKALLVSSLQMKS
jgi:hypothetical protein